MKKTEAAQKKAAMATQRKREWPPGAAEIATDLEVSAAAADQTASDADQTASDADQTASERDEADSASDQLASDRDQAVAEQQAKDSTDGAARDRLEATRMVREENTVSRLFRSTDRAHTSRLRADTAAARDSTAKRRDETSLRRDLRAEMAEQSIVASREPLSEKLERVRARARADRVRAAADRARAAADRERAAKDRAEALQERARLELELRNAHLDDLTGAYRRDMGRRALSHEIDRALRADGRFVIAYVDVDGMKQVNDRDGHAAGDNVLKTLVWTMKTSLRSFDPVVRYGGDEFVCGIGGVDLEEAKERFDAIGRSIENGVGIGISVGLAQLEPDDTLDRLTARADQALLAAKKRRHATDRDGRQGPRGRSQS